MQHPTALFVLGHSGTGKSYLLDHFIRARHAAGQTWCLLDKDVVSEVWSGPFLQALGHDPQDRDSPAFKETIRDLGYASALRIARDQLVYGLNVALPGPWNRELASGALFSTEALGFPAETRLRHIWLHVPEEVRYRRIKDRADPRDKWKLDHWDEYVAALRPPTAVEDGRIAVLDANRPIAEQVSVLTELVR